MDSSDVLHAFFLCNFFSEKHTYSGIFCTAGDALRMYNFAPKNSEVYEKCD